MHDPNERVVIELSPEGRMRLTVADANLSPMPTAEHDHTNLSPCCLLHHDHPVDGNDEPELNTKTKD